MANKYGDWLRAKREAAGLTQQELADAAIMTRSHIAHIEAGRRVPSRDDARRLDRALGTGDVLASFLPERDVVVAEYFEAARALEQQAVSLREFALSFVPGILQTEAYARTVLSTTYPPLPAEQRDQRVVTRLQRAEILNDPVTPSVWALLDEAVLRRAVGGPEVMAGQLAHLIDLVECGRIRVHILPFDLGMHPLMSSMLTLMAFDDQPPVAYNEGVRWSRIHDSPVVVDELYDRYHLALADALPQTESLAFLKARAKEYRDREQPRHS
ncbi:XRE family transcriptional regulator [Streptomyces triticagri]|uniref:XRE family transcriptional regulator n=1 Tax=Streptomyces triticagri TaxID=2293568 RepID=A0A372M6U9_9ACTN|nr:helix-turn-helix transcriptional regulator [Streptomyces triticagri]RFU86678.1 XRE family transcriptional regulator [Streptomyces triticagri]